jgi:ketosteroid isomerase-like protein
MASISEGPPSGVAAALASHRDQFMGSLRAHDAAGASTAYAADASLLPPAAGVVRGRDQIRQFWQAGLDSGLADLALESVSLTERDAVAFEIGRYAMRVEPVDGDSTTERGHYVQIHQLQPDGAWQTTVEIVSPGDALNDR